MIYLSKVKSYFKQNSTIRRLKSRLLAKSDIELYFSIIAITQETVDRCSCVVGMEEQINQRINLKKILECIDGPIKRMSTDLKGISDSFQ